MVRLPLPPWYIVGVVGNLEHVTLKAHLFIMRFQLRRWRMGDIHLREEVRIIVRGDMEGDMEVRNIRREDK